MATQQRISTEDIIRQGAESNGENFDVLYQAIEQGIQDGNIRILRHNNTLLVYAIVEKGVAEIHLYSVDQPPAMIEAFKSFYHAFKVSGFKSLHSIIEDPQLIRLIKMAKIPVQAQQTQDGIEITIEVK
jgi:hypothetical protein